MARWFVMWGGAWLAMCSTWAHAQPASDPAETPGAEVPGSTPPASAPSEPTPSGAPPVKRDAADHRDDTTTSIRDQAEPKKKRKKLEFGGRVLARGAAEKSDGTRDWIGGGTIDSARAKADYRTHGVHAQLSLELAGKVRLKNAYVQLRLIDATARLDARAGQFKMPFSAIELESRWTLPTADRGLLHHVLVDRLQVAGRAIGATMSIGLDVAGKPRLDAGAFQGSDDAGNPLEVSVDDRLGQDAVVRLSAEPLEGLAIGASGQARVGALNIDAPLIVRRAYAAEADATLALHAGPGTLRWWLEGMAGTSWIIGRTMPCQGPMACKAPFVEARSIAAFRLGGRAKQARYVELYGLAGALDPDRDTASDLVSELSAGLTYGAWDLWRIQAEAEVWRFGDNAPLGIAEFATVPVSSTRFLVQLGARL